MIKNIQLKNLPNRKSFSYGEGFRMRQPIILTILLTTLFTSANAQTTVPAGNVSGTWTKAGSPYKIQGEIIVPKGSTLTIQPGTVVEF